MDATEIMSDLNATTLKTLARQTGIAKSVTRKAELVEALQRFLSEDLAKFLELLSHRDRQFLAEAAFNGGSVEPSTYSAKYNQDCPQSGRWATRRTALLIHLVVAEDEFLDGLRVADDLIPGLQKLLPKPAEATIKTVAEIDEAFEFSSRYRSSKHAQRVIHRHCGEAVAWNELSRVLNLAQAGKLRVQEKSRRPTSATERAIAESLTTPDFDVEMPEQLRDKWTEDSGPIRAHAWPVLLQQCGWARPRKGVLTLTKQGKALMQGVDPDVYRAGVDQLVNDTHFDELNRVNSIRGQTGKGKRYLSSPPERRDAILVSMSSWPANQWIQVEEAQRFVSASGSHFAVTGYPYHYYFCERRYGYLSSTKPLNSVYTRTFLFETAATLGLIDVAYVYPHYLWPEFRGNWGTDDMDFCSRYDGLLYVRLNALGAWCLGVTDHYELPEPESRSLFTILPNRELAIAGETTISNADVGMLDLFGKRRSDRVWRLDPQRILTHVENGGSIAEVRQYLEQNSSVDLPPTVAVFLDDLEAKAHAFIGTKDAILLEVKDPAIAALIANDTRARKYCYLAGDNHVAVLKRNEKAFRTAIKKLGYVFPP